MPRNVHDAGIKARPHIETREADVDRKSAFTLLDPPICLHARQGPDECSLPVVDVTGCTENNSPGHRTSSASRKSSDRSLIPSAAWWRMNSTSRAT